MKYTYNVTENKVYCIAHYAGKAVKGVAKCDTDYDQFNCDTGMKLAKARCDFKIAKKRFRRKFEKYNNAVEEHAKAQAILEKAGTYLDEAYEIYETAKNELINLENSLK